MNVTLFLGRHLPGLATLIVGPHRKFMSFLLEIYYAAPEDQEREKRFVAEAAASGGRLDYREVTGTRAGSICLTFEFAKIKRVASCHLSFGRRRRVLLHSQRLTHLSDLFRSTHGASFAL